MPSISSTLSPPEKGWVGRSNSVMNPTCRLEHPCCSSRLPACHGCGAPARARLSLAAYFHGFDAVSEGDPGGTRCLSPISATNLLSTSTPETHQLSSTRLSSREPPLPTPAFPQHACVELGPTPSEGAPDSPKASPIPSDAAVGAATPVMAFHRFHLSRFREGPPLFFLGGVNSRVGLFTRHANQTMWPSALPVALRRAFPLSRKRAMQNRGPFPQPPTKVPASVIRSTFHR